MRLVPEAELQGALVHHPYALSPHYSAAMSVVYTSPDHRLLIGYWHAPKGTVKLPYGETIEHVFILEGQAEFCTAKTVVTAKAGDTLECGGDGQTVTCTIQAYLKALFVVYPQTENDYAAVAQMVARGAPPIFDVQGTA